MSGLRSRGIAARPVAPASAPAFLRPRLDGNPSSRFLGSKNVML